MSDSSTFKVPQAPMYPYGRHREAVYRHLISQATNISELLDTITKTGPPTDDATNIVAFGSVVRFVSDTESFNAASSRWSQLKRDVKSGNIGRDFATAVRLWEEVSRDTGLHESLRAYVKCPAESSDTTGPNMRPGTDDLPEPDVM